MAHVRFSWFPALLLVGGLHWNGVEASAEDSVADAEPAEPAAALAEGEPDLKAGAQRYALVCAQCHGAKGEGNVDLKSPSIAALPDWYVGIQIGKFQKDWRGSKPEDVPGTMMHAIAMSLDPEAVRDVAGYIKSLKLIPTTVTIEGGDPEKGAELFRERCMECHRYNGRGEPAFRSGQLIGLQDWYIISQLKKFRDGLRGGDEDDIDGAKMHRITERIPDDYFLHLTAHIAELAEKYAVEKPRRR